jgi:hypothetical protein
VPVVRKPATTRVRDEGFYVKNHKVGQKRSPKLVIRGRSRSNQRSFPGLARLLHGAGGGGGAGHRRFLAKTPSICPPGSADRTVFVTVGHNGQIKGSKKSELYFSVCQNCDCEVTNGKSAVCRLSRLSFVSFAVCRCHGLPTADVCRNDSENDSDIDTLRLMCPVVSNDSDDGNLCLQTTAFVSSRTNGYVQIGLISYRFCA